MILRHHVTYRKFHVIVFWHFLQVAVVVAVGRVVSFAFVNIRLMRYSMWLWVTDVVICGGVMVWLNGCGMKMIIRNPTLGHQVRRLTLLGRLGELFYVLPTEGWWELFVWV